MPTSRRRFADLLLLRRSNLSIRFNRVSESWHGSTTVLPTEWINLPDREHMSGINKYSWFVYLLSTVGRSKLAMHRSWNFDSQRKGRFLSAAGLSAYIINILFYITLINYYIYDKNVNEKMFLRRFFAALTSSAKKKNVCSTKILLQLEVKIDPLSDFHWLFLYRRCTVCFIFLFLHTQLISILLFKKFFHSRALAQLPTNAAIWAHQSNTFAVQQCAKEQKRMFVQTVKKLSSTKLRIPIITVRNRIMLAQWDTYARRWRILQKSTANALKIILA